jgi:hypothetical protein
VKVSASSFSSLTTDALFAMRLSAVLGRAVLGLLAINPPKFRVALQW